MAHWSASGADEWVAWFVNPDLAVLAPSSLEMVMETALEFSLQFKTVYFSVLLLLSSEVWSTGKHTALRSRETRVTHTHTLTHLAHRQTQRELDILNVL